MLLVGSGRKRNPPVARMRMLAWVCVCAAVVAAMSGCGGRGDHEAPIGNYSVPINVTSPGAASQTITLQWWFRYLGFSRVDGIGSCEENRS